MSLKSKSTNKLSNSQKVTILAALIGGCFIIVGACIGLYVPIIEIILNVINKKVEAFPTKTFTPPLDAIHLPSNQNNILSIAVNPGVYGEIYAGLVTENLDRTILSQTINQQKVIFPLEIYKRFMEVNSPSTFQIFITGKSTTEPVQISNRVPIKLISYAHVPDEVDFVSMQIGGGEDFWILSVDISEQVLSLPDQVVWAKYSTDLKSRLITAQKENPYLLENYPSELQKVILSDEESLPDYFLLSNNEEIAFSIAALFQTPGIYNLQFGIEYIFDGYKSIAWTEPIMEVYVPGNYYIWICNLADQSDNPMCNLIQFCEYIPTNSHLCTNK